MDKLKTENFDNALLIRHVNTCDDKCFPDVIVDERPDLDVGSTKGKGLVRAVAPGPPAPQ